MKLYLRYLLRQLALPALVATLAFSGAVWLSQSLRFVDLIVNKGLPVTTFLYLTALLFPSLLLIILPVALFAAVLFVYHRLTQESELTVMKAVGLSNLQLAGPAVLLASAVSLFCYTVSLYLMPLAFSSFRDLQYEIQRDFSHLLLQPGVFNTPLKDVTVYIREHRRDGTLAGILVHDERQRRQPETMMAEQGFLVQGEAGPLFVLENGNRQELDLDSDPERPELRILHFDRYTLDLAAAASPPDDRSRKPKELFLGQLFNPGDELSEQTRREYLVEAHERLTWPLNALVFALIGLAALLARGFDRRGQWKRTVGAVVAVVVVQALSMAAGGLAETSLRFVPLMYLVPLVPALGALLMIRSGSWLGFRAVTRPAPAAG
ncbi:MAG TPA: LPS export ABC transporter permease LptF [Geminicoccaceae bacterium]